MTMAAVAPEHAQKILLTLARLRAAARQTPGLERVPRGLQDAISSYMDEQSLQDVKTAVARLAMTMRDRKETARSKLPSVEELQTSPLAQQAAAEVMNDVSLQKRWQAPFEPPPVKYEAQLTVAYVAARLPSTYAAAHRVLSEVARRVPDFKPSTVMDYGSGPGTVLWAMREVWPTSLKQVNLVEPSPAMAHACRSLLKDQEGLPTIQSYNSLQAFAKSHKHKTRLHDMVVASYTLGELPSMAQRISVVRQLWALTQDVLVLIEPGTPEGFQVIQDMRKHVLQMEKKKLRKLRQGLLSQVCPMNGNTASLAGEETGMGGAFVVAPCAHDGTCPMEKSGRWCHFAQRVERTPGQRTSKQHTRSALRGYEDEKFSFVVLRHGVRPRSPWPMTVLADQLPIDEHSDPMLGDNNGDDKVKSAQVQKNLEWFIDVAHPEAEKGGEAPDIVDEDLLDDGEAWNELPPSFEGLKQEWDDKEQQKILDSPEDGANDLPDLDPQIEDAEEQRRHLTAQLAADLGGGWARIVQPPMKRGGHVYLDLCCSTATNGSEGKLERLVAVRSGTRALYLQARKSRWGDLWPC